MKAYGYVPEVNVNASASDPFGGGRPYVRTVPVAAGHRFLRDEEGYDNFPMSARHHAPAYFAWMANNAELTTTDLSDIVTLNASKDKADQSAEIVWDEDQRSNRRR